MAGIYFSMNKDTVVASVIGFGLGLIAAVILWVVPRIAPKTTAPKSTPQALSETAISSPTPAGFTISSLHDGEIAKSSSVLLEGKAPAGSLVVLDAPSDTQVVAPDKNGAFSISLTLAEGANQISVTNYYKGGQDNKTLSVYYVAEAK